MKVDIRDPEALRAIRSVDAALYLRASGWQQHDLQLGRASLWRRMIEGAEFEILLPMDSELRDYELRMGDMLGVLSTTENRSQSQVYNDLLLVTADVIRVRIADPELRDGSLPIEEHAQIAQRARDLVLAAACAATGNRVVWHKRKPAQAMEYIRRVRIGQSERGSYVVTIISRVSPTLHNSIDSLFEIEEPFERMATQALARSLKALDGAAEKAAVSQSIEAFEHAVRDGVNANLCDAVVGLWGADAFQRSLEFSFSWSPTRPPSPNSIGRVSFGSDRLPVIREAGRMMREREPIPEYELYGSVIKLERNDASPTGKVTVSGLVDDRPSKITLELGAEEYHRAVQAHDRGQSIHVVGTLVKEGRGYVLQNASQFVVDVE